jgi:Leucine-rich repeat (LRR) protein
MSKQFFNVSSSGELSLKGLSPQELGELESIKSLDFSNCNITSIKEGTFDNLTNLTELNLSNNNITGNKLPNFSCLLKLKKLNLSRNFINQLNPDKLKNLSKLEELYFSSNNIKTLNLDALLNNLPELKKCHFDLNLINKLHLDKLNSVSKLVELNLGNNEIKNLHSDTFKNLSKLVDLDLSCNRITKLDSDTFKNLAELKKLNLYGNYITILDTNTFKHLSELVELDLYNNDITIINATDCTPTLKNLIEKNIPCDYKDKIFIYEGKDKNIETPKGRTFALIIVKNVVKELDLTTKPSHFVLSLIKNYFASKTQSEIERLRTKYKDQIKDFGFYKLDERSLLELDFVIQSTIELCDARISIQDFFFESADLASNEVNQKMHTSWSTYRNKLRNNAEQERDELIATCKQLKRMQQNSKLNANKNTNTLNENCNAGSFSAYHLNSAMPTKSLSNTLPTTEMKQGDKQNTMTNQYTI